MESVINYLEQRVIELDINISDAKFYGWYDVAIGFIKDRNEFKKAIKILQNN